MHHSLVILLLSPWAAVHGRPILDLLLRREPVTFATSLPDGKHVLMTSGCRRVENADGSVLFQEGPACEAHGPIDQELYKNALIKHPGCERVVRNGDIVFEQGLLCTAFDPWKASSKTTSNGTPLDPSSGLPSDKCQTFTLNGNLVHVCPGCRRVTQTNGVEILREGESCEAYAGPAARAASLSGCQTTHNTRGQTFHRCSQCDFITDTADRTVFQTGLGCNSPKPDVKSDITDVVPPSPSSFEHDSSAAKGFGGSDSQAQGDSFEDAKIHDDDEENDNENDDEDDDTAEDGCRRHELPSGETVVACQGCASLVAKSGRTLFASGPDCEAADDEASSAQSSQDQGEHARPMLLKTAAQQPLIL